MNININININMNINMIINNQFIIQHFIHNHSLSVHEQATSWTNTS